MTHGGETAGDAVGPCERWGRTWRAGYVRGRVCGEERRPLYEGIGSELHWMMETVRDGGGRRRRVADGASERVSERVRGRFINKRGKECVVGGRDVFSEETWRVARVA